MATPLHGSTETQLAALEAEARVLESELAGLRRAIAALKAQQDALAHPAEGMSFDLAAAPSPRLPRFDEEVETPPSPTATAALPPLAPHDPLRAKWQLGEGFPGPSPTQALAAAPEEAAHGGQEAQLHLIGTLEDGRPWECHIPFSSIARAEGVSLGRDPEEVAIALPDESVSRRHALLELTEDGLVITDLASMNGTSVNGHLLTAYERRTPLQHGMNIGIGEARLRVEFIR